MVLAQKQKYIQKYIPGEQHRKHREKTHVPNGYLIFEKGARIYNGAKTASSINGARRTGQLHVKK